MHTRSRGLSTEPGYERQERNGERERERERECPRVECLRTIGTR